ncbi:hypothetical protein [Pseudonocardia asaccharolytica]|uniref:Uncharacterized protein n=1 Tax=Pseudonocardia asaccharolytica DSM 44247 = NBRC 16224 TaxID=1123024 RepID=A0A511CYT2_9PSEU|nr:hypothetical protein [Pseudonocardia asaccharolytica]GEL17719.1 hypothetical protein PA7_15560 [Pseudonocardia asaccharolytica DSM 44247 = NBRC 16224]
MCTSTSTSTTPTEPNPAPSAQTFPSTEAFLAAITPGMELCTSDFTGWAQVENVSRGPVPSVRGRRRSDSQIVEVPAGELIDLRGGHCVRIDRVRATIDQQGWEVRRADDVAD